MILDAAERRLREAGPASIRLQEVSADVGISHPAVLHHFGNREGLIQAVVERAVERLQSDLLATLAETKDVPNGMALFDRVFDVLYERGHARLIAWLVLSGYDPFDSEASRAGWEKIAEITHALRTRGRKRGDAPSYRDTRFTVILSALTLFGQAIIGEPTLRVAGFGDRTRTGREFRKWLATLLAHHLEG
ncbi:TetR/AcrR family transcriptional regulator [Pendulispora brunnea]|uniref:TetR/AcrR family transcriptional regulator n=1 Tax=Pendulispora brunnea TaxID=2905690 RepID=A0ABZ2KL97_9BACT